MPDVSRDALEGSFKAFGLIFLRDANCRNICDLSDQDQSNPAGIFAVSIA